MMGLGTCCKDCTDRHLGCHSVCEKYIAAKAKIEKLREKREQNRDINLYKLGCKQQAFDTYIRKIQNKSTGEEQRRRARRK
jgi:hypothetical protein